MRQILITVAGRNSAGKSLIAKKVAEALGLNVVKSYATRKPRPEELKKGLENCDHIFVSDEEYDKLENITAETEINGARYCTTQEVLDNSDIYVIDPKGIKDLKERCGSRYKILQFYIYADADKRAARFVARGETKAKFEAREQSEDEQFCNYENNHGWDIIIYNNWDIDTAVKTMLGYVRPIMTPVIEARQKQAEEEFEKMMNPPAEEKVEDAPADEQAGMKEQQEEEPKAEDEQTDDVPADEVPDKEAGDKNCQEEAEDEQVKDVSDKEMDDVGEQTEEPEEEKSETEESPAEEQQAESKMPEGDGEELEECQQEDASDDSSEASASTEANDDPFSPDFDDEDEDFMNIPAGVDAESDESDGADMDNDEDSADENNSDAADPFSLDDFDDTDKEDTDSSDEPEKPEEREEPDEEPDNVPEEESEPIEEHVDKSTSEPADENPDNASEIHEEPEESSDDEENDDDGEAILID